MIPQKLGFILLILVGFLTAPTPSLAMGPRCADLFYKTHSGRFLNAPEFEIIFESAKNFNDFSFQKAHQSILKISQQSQLYSRVRELEEALQILLLPLNPTNSQAKFIKSLLLVLPMTEPQADWVWILTTEQSVMTELGRFNIHGTLGHLVRALPESQKADLLAKLGRAIEREKNYVAVHAIHVILDPLARYENFKKQGGTDRDFYLFYLTLIQDFVFLEAKLNAGTFSQAWSRKPIGDYSGELPLRIAEIIHESLFPKYEHGVEFFGSVVNGFGRVGSDLDIFNHPNPELIAKGHLEAMNGQLWRFRHPIEDYNLDRALAQFIKPTEWNWKVESHPNRLPVEFYGGHSQPFLFYITKTGVELLFFPYVLSVNADGQYNLQHNSHISLDLD